MCHAFMFFFACGYYSRGQYVDGFMFTLETVVNVFVCIFRFQAQDLEVQLSDELAGSLRRLKVLHRLL